MSKEVEATNAKGRIHLTIQLECTIFMNKLVIMKFKFHFQVALVFITRNYVNKVAGENSQDNCKLEFNHAGKFI